MCSRFETDSECSPGVVVTVADVYDMAADIGKDFEWLIDTHGPETVTSLMQKVITVLEHLEQLAADRGSEECTIENLQSTITHFELGEIKKNEERLRQSRELEQIEDHYKQETRDLLATVKRLQDENRKLQSSLTAATERDSAFSEDESYFEVELVNRLQTVIDKQRQQIKNLDQEILDVKTENEELKVQNEKLTGCTKDLRRKLRSTQNQLHILVDERAELTAKVHDQNRELQVLTKGLGFATRECEDLYHATTTTKVEEGSDLKGKVVFREDDPNRPRFSLPELRDILQERNSLKAKVSDLEGELSMYRPKIPRSSSSGLKVISSSSSSSEVLQQLRSSGGGGDAAGSAAALCDCSYHTGINELADCFEASSLEGVDEVTDKNEENKEEEEDNRDGYFGDLPVHGPLPQEPEDAPWRKRESGIRKLFHRVFGSLLPSNQPLIIEGSPVWAKVATPPRPQRTSILRKSFSRFLTSRRMIS